MASLCLAAAAASCAETRSHPDAGTDAGTDAVDGTGSDCQAGLVPCGGFCVDPSSDHENCGGCGLRCRPAETCLAGRCLVECPADRIYCDGACVDTRTSPDHCGGCSRPCLAGSHAVQALCEDGLCDVVCEAGWKDPDQDGTCDAPCISTGDDETCNGLDDNCNGIVDEGFPCRMGRETACTTSCGSLGSGLCTADCTLPAADACEVREELCNGADDDCDGKCDNGFECCRGNTLVGGDCGMGGHEESPCTSSCEWGEPSCIGEGVCEPETERVCGSCGRQICDSIGQWGPCTGEVDCSRPHTVGGSCTDGICSGYACVGEWRNCDGDWDNGCEIPVGVANQCSADGLDTVTGCGTAWCGSSSSNQAQNMGSWYCIGCTNCHLFDDGAGWCITLVLDGNIQWSPDRYVNCDPYLDEVCGP
jgi:hypothetical protein